MQKFALALLLALASGCAYSPLHLVYRDTIAHRLPEGCNLTDYVENDFIGRRVSLDEKLAQIGAYPDADGVLRDGAGKRIEVVRALDESTAPPAAIEHERERRVELHKVAYVIEVRRDPPPAPPPFTPPATPPDPNPPASGWTAPPAAPLPAAAPANAGSPIPPAPPAWTASGAPAVTQSTPIPAAPPVPATTNWSVPAATPAAAAATSGPPAPPPPPPPMP